MFRKIIQNYSVTTKASRILYRQTDKTFKKLLKNHLNINNFNLRSNQPKNNKNERKTPNLFFLQNPYTWAKNKFDLKLLKYSWDKDFNENEFKIGAKTAVCVLTNSIRNQKPDQILPITTNEGYKQITHDMYSSKDDPRLNLLVFRPNDIKRAFPTQLLFLKTESLNPKKYCIIDMFTAGLRDLEDADDFEKGQMMKNYMKFALLKKKNEKLLDPNLQKFIYAQIMIRFQRNYSDRNGKWDVAFYKVDTFEILTLNS